MRIFFSSLLMSQAAAHHRVWFEEQAEKVLHYNTMKSNCAARGAMFGDTVGFPAFFRNQAEYDNFLSSVSDDELYLGYEQQNGDNNQWLNADGTEVTFTDWHNSQPNNAEHACVISDYNGRTKWHDVPCTNYNSRGYACRFETTKTANEQTHFGPIIKKSISWTEAVKECSKYGGTIAFIDNERDLSQYRAAIGLKDFKKGSRVWLGRRGWNPSSNYPYRHCKKYEPHTRNIVAEKCDQKMWFSCRYEPDRTHFGPIIKKAIAWTEAVKECSKSGGTIAFIENERDLIHYQAAIGYKAFENMVRPRVWLGRRGWNPSSNYPYRLCLKYEPHTENIVREKCDQKMWFSCRYDVRVW